MKRLILTAILFPAVILSATLEVYVPRRVKVYSENPRITEVVRIKGSWRWKKILSRERLSLNLKKGERRWLERGVILSRILSSVEADVLVKGSRKVLVIREERVITPEEIKGLVEELIKNRGFFKGLRYVVSILKPTKPIPVPYGARHILKGLYERRGLQSLSLLFLKGEKVVKRINVRVAIKLEKKVLVAKRDIERGEVIKRDDLSLFFVDLSRIPKDALTNYDEAIGKSAIRDIRGGEILRRGIIKNIPLVKSGSPVYIVAENGLLKVMALGRALESGKKGDVIRVRNESSKKIVYGEVVDRGLVMVRF